MLNLTPLILLLPLLGFVVVGLFGRALPKAAISIIACGVVFASFVLAVADFLAMTGTPVAARASDTPLWNWVSSGTLHIDFSLLNDPLSAVMLLIVTGVGFLIHVYAIGYMADDASYWRFFAFLNFFEFAMILLVASDNFLFLLIGWGLVGLASYLVIGDFGLLLAIFLLFRTFGTLAFGATSRSYPISTGGVLHSSYAGIAPGILT